MKKLYPVKYIKNEDFSGKLIINGSKEENRILFRFKFDSIEMMHPILIHIKAIPIKKLINCSTNHKEKKEEFLQEINDIIVCDRPDYDNIVMKTHLIRLNFSLIEFRIKIIKIESQIFLDLSKN